MIIVFTGNGKGKTTASLGQAMRALGRGSHVLMLQFIKGPWKSGEDFFTAKFQISSTKFQIRKMGLGFVGILGDSLPFQKHKKAAEKAFAMFQRELKKKKWKLIILDEVNVAVSLKLLNIKKILPVLKKVPLETLVILTGRGAPKEFIKIADLVTEMRDLKHPFHDGRLAKAGIEY